MQRPKVRAGTLVCEGGLRRPAGPRGRLEGCDGSCTSERSDRCSVGCGLDERDGRRQTTWKTVESRQEMVGI